MACGVAVRLFRALLFERGEPVKEPGTRQHTLVEGPMPQDALTPSAAETVATLIRNYWEGSTSPALVETGDGERFVLKFAGAGPGHARC